jgi:hypothetical protein
LEQLEDRSLPAPVITSPAAAGLSALAAATPASGPAVINSLTAVKPLAIGAATLGGITGTALPAGLAPAIVAALSRASGTTGIASPAALVPGAAVQPGFLFGITSEAGLPQSLAGPFNALASPIQLPTTPGLVPPGAPNPVRPGLAVPASPGAGVSLPPQGPYQVGDLARAPYTVQDVMLTGGGGNQTQNQSGYNDGTANEGRSGEESSAVQPSDRATWPADAVLLEAVLQVTG